MSVADFIEETTTSIAGTLGNGAVTLTALQSVAPGSMRYSNWFGTTAPRLVDYVIEDTTAAAGFFEAGLGSVNNNVLTRTSPRETWNGTALTNSGTISPLQFGSSPTSGNIRIRCAPLGSSLLHSVPFYASFGDDMGILPRLTSSNGGSPSFVAFVVGTQYFFPYFWEGNGPIIQAACAVQSGSSGTHIQFALYEAGPTGPGRCLLAFNAMSAATAVTVKDTSSGTWSGDAAASPWLPQGWYWMSWQVDSATPTFCSAGSRAAGLSAGGLISPFSKATTIYFNAVIGNTGATFGTFPNPITATLTFISMTSSSGPPLLGLKPGQ